MLIHEFIIEYCQDIVETYTATHSKLLDSFDLPYDDEIEDDSGELMKVVYCGEKAIPINDILSMSKSDFARVYPDFECRDLYDKYIESLIMLEGEDALNHIRSVLDQERQRIKEFSERKIHPELAALI
jgi:hypothetical protein